MTYNVPSHKGSCLNLVEPFAKYPGLGIAVNQPLKYMPITDPLGPAA